MPAVKATVNKKVLLWAREVMGYDLEEIAHKLNVKHEKITAWETGEAKPTLRQLEKLSDLYKQPLVTFFQEKPPDKPHWPTDYRTFHEGKRQPLSPKTRAAIWEAQWRQSVAAELRREMGVEFKFSLQNLRVGADPETAAETVRNQISPDILTQEQWARDPQQLFKRWRKVLEAIGVLVFRFDFPIEDARGFSLPDLIASVIMVSAKDYRNAAIFSLFHEFAHLLFNESSSCNDIEFRRKAQSNREEVEARCNYFAGAFLVPREKLLAHQLVRMHRGQEWSDEQLFELSRFFGVSREVVLRRLVILNRASISFYGNWRSKQQVSWKDEEPSKEGFPVQFGYARKKIAQQGTAYVRTILDAYANKIINLSEASEYLAVKTKHIHDLELVIDVGG